MTFNFPELLPYFLPLRASVAQVGPSQAEIISLSAMKEFLRDPVGVTTNDNRIASLIRSACAHAERHTGRSLVKKSYVMSLSRFPNFYWDRSQTINLWHPPLTSDVSIKYIDSNGSEKDMISGQNFQVDFAGEPGRIAPLAQQWWPLTKWGVLNAVRIFYTAGYEVNSNKRLEADAEAIDIDEPEIEQVDQIPAADQVATWRIDRTIPNDLVTAVMELVMHWYQNRVPVQAIPGAGGAYTILPWHVEKILDDYVFDNSRFPTVTPDF